MRIVHLTAGAGPMYCGSCIHGNTLTAALIAAGADVVAMPVYTPVRTDEENVTTGRLAMGGVNVYLQERSAVFRHAPRLVDRLLDWPALVAWVARRGNRTRPEDLGALTVSVLRGEEGRLVKEVEKLVAWLHDELRPDVVHLSNVMLAGLARPLRDRLGVPVVSTLSGEDSFLEKLPPRYYAEARAVLRERAGELSALVAMNGYYADFMADYLAVHRDRIHVIPPGLNLEGHRKPGGQMGTGSERSHPEGARPVPICPPAPGQKGTGTSLRSEPVPICPKTIGFLGRICPEKGLHLLVEALGLLAQEPDLPPPRIRAAGYLDLADRPYLAAIHGRLASLGLADRFEYVGELDRAAKIAFLQSLDVMSLPAMVPESKGLPLLEAWANGVPAVVPRHGAFPEMVADTGGGLLHEPSDPRALAAALARMLREPDFAADCGRRAHRAVHERYHAERMARETMELYRMILEP